MAAGLPLTFVRSAGGIGDLPFSRAEVAVMGRSNVGKSSLVNALARRRDLARTSGTPGRTQTLNLYALDGSDATLVDCPGYGYAKVSKRDREAWQDMVDRYLLDRENLRMVLALVDGEIGPTKLDVELLDWMRASSIPFTVVATKHDKVRSSRRQRRRRDLAEGCGVTEGEVVWTSAEKNVGMDRLRDLVRTWVA